MAESTIKYGEGHIIEYRRCTIGSKYAEERGYVHLIGKQATIRNGHRDLVRVSFGIGEAKIIHCDDCLPLGMDNESAQYFLKEDYLI